YPALLIQKDGEDLVLKLISQMTTGVTEPQADYLRGLFERSPASEGQDALKYIGTLVQRTQGDINGQNAPRGLQGNWRPTVGAVARALRIVEDKLKRMKITSEQMRASSKLKELPFESLPNPFSRPDE